MSRVRRRVGAVLAVVVLATALAGCQFVGDVFEGQRITNERLAVDGALRTLVAELQAIDGVESVEYGFDAADVSTTPGVHVRFAAADATAWGAAISSIERAAAGDALDGFPISATFEAASVVAAFDTRYGTGWLDAGALAVAADAASLFPGSEVSLWGNTDTAAAVTVRGADSAEQLLARLTDDPLVVQLAEDARAGGHSLGFSADGLELSGSPSAELAVWTRTALASEVPRLRMAPGADDVVLDEWVMISLGAEPGAGSIAVSWASSTEPGADGAAWAAFAATIRAGAVGAGEGPGCIPVYLSIGWPGMGNQASASAFCEEPPPSSGAADRPAIEVVRAALAAEGIVPEEFGFTLG